MKSFIIACTLLVSAATDVFANPINTNDESCGVPCAHGPVCSIYDCELCPDFPGCGTEVERRALLTKRHSECPPGVACGHGPVCSINDCDICPEFPGCNAEVTKRDSDCPPGVPCGHGPAVRPCPFICNHDGCVCIGEGNLPDAAEKDKRTPTTDIVRPCPLICDQNGCVCTSTNTTATPDLSKRTPATNVVRPCPFICNHDSCVCIGAGIPPVAKRTPFTEIARPCALICNQDGCVCTGEVTKRSTDVARPCPPICDGNGCVCATDLSTQPCPGSGSLICHEYGCECGES